MSFVEVDRSRVGWWLFGAGLGAGLLFVLHSFVGTFVFGVFIYYATRPIYGRLVGHLRGLRFGRSIAAAISIFALAMPALFLATYALLVAVRELDRLTRDAAFDPTRVIGIDPDLLNGIADPATLVELDLTEYLTEESVGAVLRGLGQATDTVAFFGIGAVHLFVMIALAFYLLRDDTRLVRKAKRTLGDEAGILDAYMERVDRDFHGIFFGNILNALLTGTIGIIAYSLLNVIAPPGAKIPAAALVGALAGVASLIPVVGMKLVYVPVALYMAALALVGGSGPALGFVVAFAAVSFVVVDTVPDLVLRPYVSGRSLHVGTLMIAYTFGPLLFGWYGIFLLPMLLVLGIHFADLVLPELLAGIPLEPRAIDPGNVMQESVSPPPETDAGDDPGGSGVGTAGDQDAPRGVGGGDPGTTDGGARPPSNGVEDGADDVSPAATDVDGDATDVDGDATDADGDGNRE